MADADDKLDFCKQALGELGTRSTITSLDPPDGSQEAYYCNLFFNGTRDQVLRAAHWSFAGRTESAVLWKAAPGTPESPAMPALHIWNNRYPAPPWLYSYRYPLWYPMQVRRLRGQLQTGSDLIFRSISVINTNDECSPFEVASDRYDRDGTFLGSCFSTPQLTMTNAGQSYQPGDYLELQQSGSVYGQPVLVLVMSTLANGAVATLTVVDGGTFTTHDTSTLTQASTTGTGSGFAATGDFQPHSGFMKIILTNAQNPVIDFTTSDIAIAQYDSLFADAFMLALEGKLALALIGDRALYTAKLQEANNSIINARVRDGNEGLTTYDHVPDWLQVRGVASMSSAGEWFNPPYGPLFAV